MAPARRSWLRWLGVGTGLLAFVLVVGCLALWATLPSVDGLARTNPKSTAFIDLRRDEAARDGRKFKLRWTWRPIARISPYLRSAVVHAEDAKFWKHEGVDWDAMKDAAERNLEERSLGVGGSTITQQLAKNLYLSPSRSLVRKLREALIAHRLEAALDKRRILELYLNVAEWGDGVFGAEAAARAWFGCAASELAPAQAARLAAALPNPITRSPRIRSAALDRKAARLVRAMRRDRLIDDDGLRAALTSLGQQPRD